METAGAARPRCADCGRPLRRGASRCDRCAAKRAVDHVNAGWSSPSDPLDDWHWSWLVAGAGVLAAGCLLVLLGELVLAVVVLTLCLVVALGLEHLDDV